jgi:PAS domain S-box-containing protein
MNILIADDDATNLKLLRSILEMEGHHVLDASDGIQAFKILENQPVDAIISDILMPHMDGYRLCYEVRRSERFHNLPFITYTATYTSPADERLCMDLGADKYLRKPASAAALLLALDEATVAPHKQPSIEMEAKDVLKEYSERLVDKLEEKNHALRERTEQLRITHAQLRHQLAHSPAVLYTLKIEGDRLIPVLISDNMERLLGVTPEKATYDWWESSLHPEDYDRTLAAVMAGRETRGYTIQYRIRHADGSYRWIEDSNRVVLDGDTPVELVGLWTDITERKRLEGELILREQQLSSFFTGATAGLALLDSELRYVQINRTLAEMNGSSMGDHIGRTIQEVIPTVAMDIAPLMQQVLVTGEPILNVEVSGETPAEPGVKRHWIDSFFPIAGLDGKPSGVGVIVVEVTERVNLQEQFLQAQKMESLGALAGGIAHDFNNLLTGMLGYAELAQLKLPADSPVQEDIEEIRKSAERAASLTKQLLSFARKEVVEPRIVDLNELTLGLENLINRLLGSKIELAVTSHEDLGRVKVDPSQFEQVLVNLAVNARDAMPDGGKLTIQANNVTVDEPFPAHKGPLPAGEYVVLTVADNGEGMSKELHAKVFDPFFTTKKKGTGLGLSTCFGIIKHSGGHISVYSEVGVGTRFSIYLPRVDDPLSAHKAEKDQTVVGGNETILVVEDEETVRKLMVQVLRDSGYEVLQASNGQEALDLASEHKEAIHLLVTDIVMPELGGRELSEALSVVRPAMNRLFISGFTDDAMVHQGVLSQDFAFLQKPFSPNRLAQKVRQTLDRPKQS